MIKLIIDLIYVFILQKYMSYKSKIMQVYPNLNFIIIVIAKFKRKIKNKRSEFLILNKSKKRTAEDDLLSSNEQIDRRLQSKPISSKGYYKLLYKHVCWRFILLTNCRRLAVSSVDGHMSIVGWRKTVNGKKKKKETTKKHHRPWIRQVYGPKREESGRGR